MENEYDKGNETEKQCGKTGERYGNAEGQYDKTEKLYDEK